MARRNPQGGYIIAAGEVAAFSVCAQSWDLLWNKSSKRSLPLVHEHSESAQGQLLHEEWASFFEQSLELSGLIRYLAVLICIVSVFFIFLPSERQPLSNLFSLSLSSKGLQLIVLVSIAFWLVRKFIREGSKKRRQAGFESQEIAVAMEGSTFLPEREYISEQQGLAGRPDALLKEGELTIPVERKPLAKKLRDRYVVQLLIYMRLVEEFEGQRPPYGYLFLGKNCRRVKVVNSEKRQAWVDDMLVQMRGILDGGVPSPTPHPMKCSKCKARDRCSSRLDVTSTDVSP